MSIDPTALDELLTAIYDAALEPDQWREVLARLAGVFRAGYADRFARPHDWSSVHGIAHGLDDADYQEQLLGVWAKRNVWSQRRPVKAAGEILTTREILSREDLVRSEMYADYLRPRGLHEGMRLVIWSGSQGIEDISLLRPWSMGFFSKREIALAQRLLPHLRRSANLSRRLMAAELASMTTEATPARLHDATVLLDDFGRVVYANPAAEALLRTGDGLTVSNGILLGSTPGAHRNLQHARHAASRIGGGARSSAIRLKRPSEQPDLIATVLPFNPAWRWIAPHRPRVLVVITGTVNAAASAIDAMRAAFRLTNAEAALAEAIARGETLIAIAERTGRSVNTLRTHLARVMAKCGVTRQSELVRLALSNDARLLSPR